MNFTLWGKVITGPADLKGQIYIDGDILGYDGIRYYDSTGTRFWPRPDDGVEPEEVSLDFVAYTDPMEEDTFFYDCKETEHGSATGGSEGNGDNAHGVYKGYTIKLNASEQSDFMYAVTKGAKDDGNKVNLNFRHALSQICFKSVNKNEHIDIYVKSIEILDLVGKGDYHFPSVSTNDNYENHTSVIEEDPNKDSRGNWVLSTEESDKQSYILDFNDGIKTDEVGIGEHGTNNAFKTALNLLPQTKENMGIKLVLDVINKTSDSKWKLAENFEVAVSTNVNWLEGNRYTYTLLFDYDWTPDGLSAIKIDVSVDDFVNAPEEEWHYTGDPSDKVVPMRYASYDDEGKLTQTALYVDRCNLGADYPYDPGLYFYYGDVQGHRLDADGKFDFNFSCYNSENIPTFGRTGKDSQKWDGGNAITIAGLIPSGYLEDTRTQRTIKTGTVNGVDQYKTVDIYKLTDKYNAAKVFRGEKFDMLSREDWEWLTNPENADWEFKTINGTPVWKVTSKTTKGVVYFPETNWANANTGNYYGGGSFDDPGNQLQSDPFKKHASPFRLSTCYDSTSWIMYQGSGSTSYGAFTGIVADVYVMSFPLGQSGDSYYTTTWEYVCGGCPIRAVTYENPDISVTPDTTEE